MPNHFPPILPSFESQFNRRGLEDLYDQVKADHPDIDSKKFQIRIEDTCTVDGRLVRSFIAIERF